VAAEARLAATESSLVATQTGLAASTAHTAALIEHVEKIQATRTFRYSQFPRKIYGWLRRGPSRDQTG
jgi:hypothetical protein